MNFRNYNQFFSAIILFIIVVFSFTSCLFSPEIEKFNVNVSAPIEANLVVKSSSIGTKIVPAGSQSSFIVNNDEEISISVDFLEVYDDFEIFQWNGASPNSDFSASTVISSDKEISVNFKKKFTITFTAPANSNLEIFKAGEKVQTVMASNSYEYTDWIGTELNFCLENIIENYEINIVEGNATKLDQLRGSLEISSDDEILLTSSLMPYIVINAPNDYDLTYAVNDEASKMVLRGDSIAEYIPSESILNVSIKDLDVDNYSVDEWGVLTATSNLNGVLLIDEDVSIDITISQLMRELEVTEPAYQAYVKVHGNRDLSDVALSGCYKDGKTIYSIGSGNTYYLSKQNVNNESFMSWGSDITDSIISPLELKIKSNTTSSPIYLSSVPESGIAYVSHNGFELPKANGSKALPFLKIQDAIDSIEVGEVKIACGTYNIEENIIMKPNVSLLGSYSVSDYGSIWTTPSFTTSSRGVGGDLNTTISLNIIEAGTSDNYISICKFSGNEFGANTKVSGINFSYDTLSRSYVSGMLFENGANPTIEHCNVISGMATNYSEGVRSLNSSPIFSHTIIKSGEASSSIGVYNTGSIKIKSSEIDTSQAANSTIGIYNSGAIDLLIEDCFVKSRGLNSDGFFGYSYGIYNLNSSSTIKDSLIEAGGGGPTSSFGITYGTRALYENNSTSSISNNTISALSSSFAGSGVAYYASISPTILINNKILIASGASAAFGMYLNNSNVVVAGNIIDVGRVLHGGAIYGLYSYNSNPVIINNTIEGGNSGASDQSSYGLYLRSGSAIITNNIFFSKSSSGPRYGVYCASNSIVPKYVSNNAFFDLTTALYAPQGNTSVYHVTSPIEFTTSRTGIDLEKMVGNIGESIDNTDDNWTVSTIFTDYANNDYSINSNANSEIKNNGVEITSSLIQDFIDEIGAIYSESNVNISDSISKDMNENPRNSSKWSMGAIQY
ncbi:MAG: hypothetical protein EOL97_09980 [Spirochaetia bacterium]|nr:hypothetical protein [Spirochaetia bacterium]